MHPKGKANQLNNIRGVASAVLATTDEMIALNQPLYEGNILFNKDTKEIKISDGKTPPMALSDHKHPYSHAPLIHSHMHGTNEPWLMSNPRLWYLDDLPNHPELVPLDGSEISDDRAEFLSQVYPGTKLLTTSGLSLTTKGYENDDLILKAKSSVGDFLPARLFNGELTLQNISDITDQWFAGSSNLNEEQIITITFKGNHAYRPTEYWVCPAAGTAERIALNRPTPNSWVFEGSIEGDENWEIIDAVSGEDASKWAPWTTRFFTCVASNVYKALRLRITSWNAGAEDGMNTGLRRLWIMGRKNNVFALPDIPSPYSSFVWVVPYKNLNVGLKHEDVGDIGTTAVLPINLPTYRLATDGSSKKVVDYDLLFSAIGHQWDQRADIKTLTASDGTINDGAWNSGLTDPNMPAYLEATLENEEMVGAYSILRNSIYRIPKTWTLEGFDGSNWEVLHSVTGMTEEEFPEDGKFYLDTTTPDIEYTKYRINFLEWIGDTGTIGTMAVQFFTHKIGEFYLPYMEAENGATSYIVSDINAVDVTPDIIQRLQNNVVALSQSIASISNQLNDLDPNVSKG